MVAIVAGGNVDRLLLSEVIRHGLLDAGRFLSLRVRGPDRAGELARLLAVLADTGGNVLDVEHRRTGRGLHIEEVEVAVQLETRGPSHSEAVGEALRGAGWSAVPG